MISKRSLVARIRLLEDSVNKLEDENRIIVGPPLGFLFGFASNSISPAQAAKAIATHLKLKFTRTVQPAEVIVTVIKKKNGEV